METTARRLVALDLDDTLAPIAKPASEKAVSLLKDLLSRGDAIALCSGKPLYYLTGFARQLGIEDIYLIGENGATLQHGVALPPSKRYVLTKEKEAIRLLKNAKKNSKASSPASISSPMTAASPPSRRGRRITRLSSISMTPTRSPGFGATANAIPSISPPRTSIRARRLLSSLRNSASL